MKLRSRKAWARVAAAALFACALAGATQPASMAASNVTVTFTVASQTTLVPTLCATGMSGRTDFGSVLPATKTISGADCRIEFGSTNDTARLMMTQTDREGGPLWGGEASGGVETDFGGGDGIATDSFVAVSHETGFDAAVQPDMKIVVAGRAWFAGSEDHSISRYNPDGSRDVSFGTGGNTRTAIAGSESTTAVAIEADGHIITAGRVDAAAPLMTYLVRYDSSGNLDTAWGTGGYVAHDLAPAAHEEPLDMVVQPDGKFIVVGVIGDLGPTANGYAARFLANGSLDPSFGVGGVRSIDVNGSRDVIWSIELQADGSMLLAGHAMETTFSRDDMLVVKLTSTGSFDNTFGGVDGIATFDAGTGDIWDKAFAVERLPNGKILLGGTTQYTGGDDELMLLRLNANGTLDTTFGVNGEFFFDSTGGQDNIIGMDVLPDGTIAVSGSRQNDLVATQSWRILANGSIDTRYGGGDGYVEVPIPGYTQVNVRTQIIHADGSILMVGDARNTGTGDDDYLLVRLDSTSVPSYSGGAWTAATPQFGACLRDATNATPTWTEDADLTCTAVDTDPWKAIARIETDPTAEIARAANSVDDAIVDLRFGVNLAANQRPGALVAPVTFQVIAPA